MKTRWSSPLASAIRFDSHVSDASRVASQLSGCSEPIFKWIYTTDTIEDATDSDAPDNRDHQAEARGIVPGNVVNVVDEEDAATIAEEEAALEEEEEMALEEEEEVIIVSEILQTEKCGDEDTSTIEHTEEAMILQWTKLVRLIFNLVMKSISSLGAGFRMYRKTTT